MRSGTAIPCGTAQLSTRGCKASPAGGQGAVCQGRGGSRGTAGPGVCQGVQRPLAQQLPSKGGLCWGAPGTQNTCRAARQRLGTVGTRLGRGSPAPQLTLAAAPSFLGIRPAPQQGEIGEGASHLPEMQGAAHMVGQCPSHMAITGRPWWSCRQPSQASRCGHTGPQPSCQGRSARGCH